MKRYTHLPSPLGALLAEADADGALTRLAFPGAEPSPDAVEDPAPFAVPVRDLPTHAREPNQELRRAVRLPL